MTIATIVEYLESWEINQYTVKIRAETSVALSKLELPPIPNLNDSPKMILTLKRETPRKYEE